VRQQCATLLNYCGIGRKVLEFVVDRSNGQTRTPYARNQFGDSSPEVLIHHLSPISVLLLSEFLQMRSGPAAYVAGGGANL